MNLFCSELNQSIIIFLILFLILTFGCNNDRLVNPNDPNYTPSLPKNFNIIQIDAAKVKLQWEKIGSTIGFKIERKEEGGVFIEIGNTDERTTVYIDTTVAINKHYYYRIKAFTNYQSSGYIEGDVYVEFKGPNKLQLTQITETSIRLDWNDQSEFEEGFKILKKKSSELYFNEIFPTKKDDTSYVDIQAQFGNTYYYKVYAYSGNVNSDTIENSIEHVFLKPQNFSFASRSESEIELYWDYQCDLEDGFKIQKNINYSQWNDLASLPANILNFHDTNLSSENIYSYRVRAFSSSSTSEWTPEITLQIFRWVPINLGTSENINSIWFINENEGWISVGDYSIRKTIDGGKTWKKLDSKYPYHYGNIYTYAHTNFYDLKFFDSFRGWATTTYERVITTTDGAESWLDKKVGTKEIIYDVYFHNENDAWIVTKLNEGLNPPFRIYHTNDGGLSWDCKLEKTEESIGDVYFISSEIGFASGYRKIWKTYDGGNNWVEKYSYVFPGVASIWHLIFPSTNVGYALGLEGFLKTTNSGEDWEMFTINFIPDCVFFLNENIGWTTSDEKIIKTEDGCITWSFENTPPINKVIRDIYFLNENLGWVVGDDGLFLMYTDELQWVKINL